MSDDKVTVELLLKAPMVLNSALDADSYYTNRYQCRDYPELTKVVSGTKRRYPRVKQAPETRYYVGGVMVPPCYQSIADAINAYREARADGK